MENDSRPNSDKIRQTTDSAGNAGVDDVSDELLAEEEDDVHVCKKCDLEFRNIQVYLEHKIKHDNYRVKYCRSDVDKRMLMPILVHKVVIKKEPNTDENLTRATEEKENEKKARKDISNGGYNGVEINTLLDRIPLLMECEYPKYLFVISEEKSVRYCVHSLQPEDDQGGRGKKKVKEVNTDLVIKEKPVYVCNRCDRKFSRESILRRHRELDHDQEDVDEDLASEPASDDERDAEYRPNLHEIREANEEEARDIVHIVDQSGHLNQSSQQASGDPDILAENQSGNQTVTVEISEPGDQSEAPVSGTPPRNKDRTEQHSKTQKYLDADDKASRKYVCRICGNRFKERTILRVHLLTHSNKREFACKWQNCQYSFKTKGSLKRHVRRHTGERPFPCDMCGRNFSESGALTRHLKSRIPCSQKSDNDLPRYGKKWTDASIPAAMLPENIKAVGKNDIRKSDLTNMEDGNVFSEPEPEVVGGDTISAIVHVLEGDLQKEGVMLQIEEVASSEVEEQEGVEVVIDSSEDQGLATVDSDLGQFVGTEMEEADSVSTTCKVCDEDYISVETLQIHLRSHLADTAFKCSQCHYVTENNVEFENHMFSHHHLQIKGSDPFANLTLLQTVNKKEAEVDDSHKEARVAMKQLLDLPRESSEPTPGGARLLYKCPVCLKRFRGMNYLKLHMRNHTGLRPHKCSLCNKAFITKDTLNKHMSVHVEERHFKCAVCGKLFKRLSHVREHLRIHSTSRPFQCTVCEKTFKTNNAMKVHLRTHSDIFPYECNFCHRRFRERGSIQRHTRIHTGDKPYQCRFCFRRFAEHGTLNRHLKAKVSCNRDIEAKKTRGETTLDLSEYPTVLAEFSSVVADTQQYIVPQDGETTPVERVEQGVDEAQQAAEFVVVQTDEEGEEYQNLEIITEDGGNTSLMGAEPEYIVITDPDEDSMRVVNSLTGETIATIPITHGDTADAIRTITIRENSQLTEFSLAEPTVTNIEVVEEMMNVGDGGTTSTSTRILETALRTVNVGEHQEPSSETEQASAGGSMDVDTT